MERLADWKSAVDPTSGKTYWYHRKTRESRWVKPQFIEEIEPVIDNPVQSKLNHPSHVSDTSQNRPSSKGSQFKGSGLIYEREVYRFYSGDAKSDISGLNKLFNAISDKSFERSLLLDTSIISDLSTFAISTSDSESRWLALRCLWKLTIYRHISSRSLQQNSTWKGLATYISKWKQPSIKLITLALFSCTIIGETTDFIPDEDYAVLCGEAKSMYINNDALSASEQAQMDRTLNDLAKQILFFSSEQGKKGHVLPSFLLLLISKYHLYSPAPLSRVLASNISACLQRVYVAHQVFEESEIAIFAKELLLQCMVKSVDVLEGVLEGFLAISTDISQTAKALGPSPSTYAYLKGIVSEAELEEAVHAGLFEVKTYHDLPDEAAERFLRDVEWIPKSGVGWQLNSVLLWLRCPALRDLVNDFWQQGGGSHTAETAGSVLELSIDASDEVVETICHYVHYGGLILPPTLQLQLETLKVASELGLLALQDQMEHFLRQDVCADNLDTLYQAAKENGYRHIEDSCVRFMNGELQDHRREEGLQRTLASSITGGFHAPQQASKQLRTKDLHDFEDIPDDVLQGTFATHNAGSTRGRRDEHLSETFAGHLSASNPSVDYRTMNDEADNYLQSFKLPKKVQEYQEYQEDMQYSHQDHRPASGGSHLASSKLKSGGIYSLLLGDNEDGFGGDDMYGTDQFGQHIMKESTAKKPGSAGSAGSKAGLAHTTGSGRKTTGGGAKNGPQLQEFDPNTMSLVPKKEKNEQEKRLEELSKPRTNQRKSAADLEVDTSTNSDPYDAETSDRPSVPSSTRSATNNNNAKAAATTPSSSRPGTASKKPTSASNTSANKAGTSRPGTREKESSVPSTNNRMSYQNNPYDEELPDDLYLQQDDFAEEREEIPAAANRMLGPRSAPHAQRPSSSSSRGNAPLLSSTSNPRMRTSTDPILPAASDGDSPVPMDRQDNHDNNPPTQIRSSLALLKAKVSKTGGGPGGGRSRRISAGAAVGNFAGSGTDSEYSSPVPSSSSAAGQISGPSSLNNTLDGNNNNARVPANTLRQSFNRTGSSDRYGQRQQQQAHREEDDDYADDFDAPTDSYHNTTASRTAVGGGKAVSKRPTQSSAVYGSEAEEEDVPPRSSAADYLKNLEQAENDEIDANDDNYGAEFAGGNTEECPDCGRHFAPEPFIRHAKVCKKVFLSKRKVFDSSKQRLDANPETLAAAKKNGKKQQKPGNAAATAAAAGSGVSKWKEQSRQFREAMRSARGATGGGDVVVAVGGGGGGGGAPAPSQPYIDPTLIQCPNCQRRFNDKAAERHIPVCKSIIAKPASLKKGGGQQAGSLTATQNRTVSNTAGGSNGGGFNGARTTGGRSTW